MWIYLSCIMFSVIFQAAIFYHSLTCTYCVLLLFVLCPFSCLELIIEEQVEKLNATLRGIETLSVVARDTASKLTELIGADEVWGREGGRAAVAYRWTEGGGADNDCSSTCISHVSSRSVQVFNSITNSSTCSLNAPNAKCCITGAHWRLLSNIRYHMHVYVHIHIWIPAHKLCPRHDM